MQIAIGLYHGFTALDAIGPYQVLTRIPDAEVILCAAVPGTIEDDTGLLRIVVDNRFDEVPRPDLLLVPGGLVSRKLAARGHPIVDWVGGAHPHTTWTTSVCTGSLLLGAAGLLRGLPATTHWTAYETLSSYGAQPTEDRVVFAGKVVTAAGVSAGIDLALVLAARVGGAELAQAIQLSIEYDPQPPFDAGSPTKAPAHIRDLLLARARAAEADLLVD